MEEEDEEEELSGGEEQEELGAGFVPELSLVQQSDDEGLFM